MVGIMVSGVQKLLIPINCISSATAESILETKQGSKSDQIWPDYHSSMTTQALRFITNTNNVMFVILWK